MGKEIVVGWDGFWKEKLEVQFYGLFRFVSLDTLSLVKIIE